MLRKNFIEKEIQKRTVMLNKKCIREKKILCHKRRTNAIRSRMNVYLKVIVMKSAVMASSNFLMFTLRHNIRLA